MMVQYLTSIGSRYMKSKLVNDIETLQNKLSGVACIHDIAPTTAFCLGNACAELEHIKQEVIKQEEALNSMYKLHFAKNVGKVMSSIHALNECLLQDTPDNKEEN